MRTFLVAPASPTKDWRARNQTNKLACAIANLAESLKGRKSERLKVIWLKVFPFG
jgi:hypothetical protein